MLEISQEWLLHITPFRLKETTTPTDAEVAPNWVAFYAKDNGSGVSTLCYKNDAATEICLPSSGTIVTGTGVSGRLAFWNGTSTLTSDSDLTFSVDTLTATKIIAPTSVTISTLTSGSLVFAGASGLLSQDNSNLFWDDTNNRLGIGTTTPERTLHAILSGSATQPIGAHNYSGGATTPINGVLFRSARGTVGSPTAMQANDTAVVLAFQGYGATGFSSSKRASVEMLAGENWTDAAQGTYLRFLTTALTGTTTAERFRVGPSGQWGIGGATFGTAGQYFRSGGASAAPTWATIAGSEITGAALTKTDDTNVTLTLGGSASTALLNAASLTLGWTGQLAVSRGGTGQSTLGSTSVLTGNGTSGVGSSANFTFDGSIAAVTSTGTTGFGWSQSHTQTAPDAAAVSGAHLISSTLSANSATNELLLMAFNLNVTNALTGGGQIQNLRAVSVGLFTNASTNTGTMSGFYVERAGSTPTVSSAAGMRVQNMGAANTTNAIGIEIVAQSGATNNYDMSFGRVDTTAAGAYYGRIPVLYNGLLKYIHVFSA